MKRSLRTLHCRERRLTIGEKTLIMGILNVTPDSFSDGGLYVDVERAVAHARQMVADGADLIDIGGESTRPGAEHVSEEVELERVLPVVTALHASVDVPLSIDTYKAEVARQALVAGAHLINDVSGLQADPQMAAVIAAFACPVILMHNRLQAGTPHVPPAPYDLTTDTPIVADVVRELQHSVARARAAGIADEQILLDPGIGFAKSHPQNVQLLGNLQAIVALGYPVVLGTSRKRVIRQLIDAPADDCGEGTAASIALGIAQGCHVMRVHDVRAMKRVALVSDAILAPARAHRS